MNYVLCFSVSSSLTTQDVRSWENFMTITCWHNSRPVESLIESPFVFGRFKCYYVWEREQNKWKRRGSGNLTRHDGIVVHETVFFLLSRSREGWSESSAIKWSLATWAHQVVKSRGIVTFKFFIFSPPCTAKLRQRAAERERRSFMASLLRRSVQQIKCLPASFDTRVRLRVVPIYVPKQCTM